MNWKNRYGTDHIVGSGRKAETVKGDLLRLTPKQRRRVRKKENRASDKPGTPRQKDRVAENVERVRSGRGW